MNLRISHREGSSGGPLAWEQRKSISVLKYSVYGCINLGGVGTS